ncbi:MAG: beta-ketoacyl-ACP synthase [Rhodobiaceae bacterium]|nr:beta-ketoacyl-ACP synthase [Rhodobiaceae bacterium]MCC0040941.1 beta-ketoacyl-ACP synthase [Rhodobiaceae bacterium]
MNQDVWITGIGIVSSLGEGIDQHWQALTSGARPVLDRETIPPFAIHPMVELDLSKQIPKRGDQRQMEPWQRLGVYAAGLAIDDAGARDPDLLESMDMIIAAGGGERDIAVDNQILTELLSTNDAVRTLIERLSNDLRPTLFLAQLPNLVAGNISIVHGVRGSSRTFMGEEAAGFDAVRNAHARIAAGQSRICLVGGSLNAAREDMILLYEMGGYNWTGEEDSVWARADGNGGLRLGSMGVFLMLESADHARARGATPVAAVRSVAADRCAREPGAITSSFGAMWQSVSGGTTPANLGIVSGATGVASQAAEELAFLRVLDAPIRATATRIGHGVEAQFLASLAFAAMCVDNAAMFAPLDTAGVEQPANGACDNVLVTGIGHWRGEGLALVTRANI